MVDIIQMQNRRAEKALRESDLSSAPDIQPQQVENVRTILEQGMIKGDNPRAVALNLVGRIDPVTKKRTGGTITLSVHQIEERDNALHWLEQLDIRYLSLEIRDKRYDRSVKKAIETGRALPQDYIERIMIAYENKALKKRADMIAQTEMMRAINRSERASIQKAIDEGLKEQKVTKWWDDAGDSRTRPTHLEMGKRYSKDKAIPFNEPFISSSGAKLQYPGDTSLGAPEEETNECRCIAHYKVNWCYDYENGND